MPPRLTGRRERKQHPRSQQQSAQQSAMDEITAASVTTTEILPKIENWDNEMANNIPVGASSTSNNNGPAQPVRGIFTRQICLTFVNI